MLRRGAWIIKSANVIGWSDLQKGPQKKGLGLLINFSFFLLETVFGEGNEHGGMEKKKEPQKNTRNEWPPIVNGMAGF